MLLILWRLTHNLYQCDEKRPQCSRCLRLNICCPGYRDLGDLIFRDESARIVRKTSPSAPVKLCFVKEPQGALAEDLRVSWLTRSTAVIVAAPSSSIEELGECFFFTRYVYSNPTATTSTIYAWLRESYVNNSGAGVLRSAITALALAAICNISYAPRIESRAIHNHQRALKIVQRSLSKRGANIEDSTLMAAMLLSQYEVRTAEQNVQHVRLIKF